MIRFLIFLISALCAAPVDAQEDTRLLRIYANTRGLHGVPIEEFQQAGTLWLICLGQSNAANSGEVPRGIQPGVFNYFDGKIYPARDPLLGATGRGSNVWTAVGTELVKRGMAKRVVLIPFAVGATSIERWNPGDAVGASLNRLLAALKANGIKADFILWQQGESDAENRSYSETLLQLRTGLTVSGQPAPMLVALASRKRSGVAQTVRQGQVQAAETSPCVFVGPDADAMVGPQNRRDGLHFSTAGQDRLASMWADRIEAVTAQRSRCPN